jgi:hypothetical protein
VLIYPEWEYINPEFKNKLIQYVENGGRLLIIGAASTRYFLKELGVQPKDSTIERVNRLEFNGRWASVKSNSQLVNPTENVITFGNLNYNKLNPEIYSSAASIRKLGKGEIAGVYLNLGDRYLNGKVTVARDFLHELVNTIFPDPMVTVRGSHNVDVSVNRINGKLAINLVNTAGPNANSNVYVYDDIPPLGPLQISVRLDKKPKNVSLEPSGLKLNLNYDNKLLKVTIPRLELYEILLIEE